MGVLRILIVVDEKAPGLRLARILRSRGYSVAVLSVAELKVSVKQTPSADFVILGPMAQRERRMWQRRRAQDGVRHIPVLKLRKGSQFRTKAFDLDGLLDRIHKFEEHPSEVKRPSGVLEHSGVSVDFFKHQAYVNGQPVHLEPIALELLCLFLREPGRTFTRSELLGATTHSKESVADRSIDFHICNLRRQLKMPDLIEAITGVGFRLREDQSKALWTRL
jgi:DNA-binding response OmpR family regulator